MRDEYQAREDFQFLYWCRKEDKWWKKELGENQDRHTFYMPMEPPRFEMNIPLWNGTLISLYKQRKPAKYGYAMAYPFVWRRRDEVEFRYD